MKTKRTKFSEKQIFLTPPLGMCAYQGVRDICVSENFVGFVFL